MKFRANTDMVIGCRIACEFQNFSQFQCEKIVILCKKTQKSVFLEIGASPDALDARFGRVANGGLCVENRDVEGASSLTAASRGGANIAGAAPRGSCNLGAASRGQS